MAQIQLYSFMSVQRIILVNGFQTESDLDLYLKGLVKDGADFSFVAPSSEGL